MGVKSPEVIDALAALCAGKGEDSPAGYQKTKARVGFQLPDRQRIVREVRCAPLESVCLCERASL